MQKFKVTIRITPKKGVLDVQGKAVLGSLHNSSLGYSEVRDVRVGRFISFIAEAENEDEVRSRVSGAYSKGMSSEKDLVNPNTEEYECVIELV